MVAHSHPPRGGGGGSGLCTPGHMQRPCRMATCLLPSCLVAEGLAESSKKVLLSRRSLAKSPILLTCRRRLKKVNVDELGHYRIGVLIFRSD